MTIIHTIILFLFVSNMVTALILFRKNKEIKKLLAKIKNKDKVFGIIAHDLKSPFQTLIGYSRAVIEDLDNLSKTSLKYYIGEINILSNRTLNLLDNLLNWSLVDGGEITTGKELINISGIIQEVLDDLSFLSCRKNIRIFKTNIVGKHTFFNRNALHTVLRNLIHNAVKFTFEGGRINIVCELIDNKIQLSIQDSGTGIEKEKIRKIFCNKVDIPVTGTANEKGAGLGLSICKHIIEQCNEKIWVESTVGKGTSFYITIPATNGFTSEDKSVKHNDYTF